MTTQSIQSITIYADGGGGKDSTTGAGCILKITESGIERFIKIVAYLGQATNNEAEISATLIGLAFINSLDNLQNIPIKVVSDSEYTLKSATIYIKNWLNNNWKTANREPVKNRGLWEIFLKLTKNFTFETEHVRGHTGHLFNEACDNASTWARNNGAEMLDTSDDNDGLFQDEFDEIFKDANASIANTYIKKVTIPKNPAGNDWTLIDLREFIILAREGNVKDAVDLLKRQVNSHVPPC